MKTVSLILDRTLENKTIKNVVTTVDSLDQNLVALVRSFVEDEALISFGKYYENGMLMNFDRKFPYILRNGKYEWCVPYDEVTIKEFIETNDICNENEIIIYVDVNCFGGGGDLTSQLIDWIQYFWPLVEERVVDIEEFFKYGKYFITIIKYFSNRNKDIAFPVDVAEVINKRKSWSLDELGSVLGTDDEEFLDKLLLVTGFKRKEDVYKRRLKVFNKYRNKWDYYRTDCWNSSEKLKRHDLFEIPYLAEHINIILTDIKMHSIYYKSDAFDIADDKLNKVISSSPYLERGEYFKFIVLSDAINQCSSNDEAVLQETLHGLQITCLDTLDFLRNKSS